MDADIILNPEKIQDLLHLSAGANRSVLQQRYNMTPEGRVPFPHEKEPKPVISSRCSRNGI